MTGKVGRKHRIAASKIDLQTPSYPFQGKIPFSRWSGNPGPLPSKLGKNKKNSEDRQRWFEDQLFEIAKMRTDRRVPWGFEFLDGKRYDLDKGCVGFAIANGVVLPPPNGAPICFLELNAHDSRFQSQPQPDLRTKTREIVAGVTADDVRKAAAFIDGNPVPTVKAYAGTSQWAQHDFLMVNGRRYPLKIIGAIAHRLATGKELGTGHANTIMFTRALASLGFQKAEDGADEPVLQELRQRLEDEQEYRALTNGDARLRTLRAIAQRQGGRAFREALLRAYDGRCAVTGCDVPEALEAAHIVSYQGAHTDLVSNGLLLRADIHTLFDLHLIAVDPSTLQLRVSATIRHHDHAEGLSALRLRLPADPTNAPNCRALQSRLEQLR